MRSLVGLERQAATDAMSRFLIGRSYSANQIQFIQLVVAHLTEHGVMPAERLYRSPFTDLSPQGPDAMFPPSDVDELIDALHRIRQNAVAA